MLLICMRVQVCRASMDYLVEEIRAIEPKLEAYQQLGLPMQVRQSTVLTCALAGLLHAARAFQIAADMHSYASAGLPAASGRQRAAGAARRNAGDAAQGATSGRNRDFRRSRNTYE